MQTIYIMQFTCVVSSMTRLTAQEGTLPAHLSRVLKMFLKHIEKNELKEPSECTFSVYIKVIHTYTFKNSFMP